MKKLIIALLSLCVLGTPLALMAAPAFYLDDEASFSNGEPIADDAYIVGNNIEITREVRGDLVIVGGEVIISANVTGDLMVVSGRVNVNGKIGDDIRVAAGEVTINNEVGDDLLVASGRVVLSDAARIGGDVAANAQSFNQFGLVKGNISVKAEEVRINSVVEGNADIRLGEDLSFGPNGRVGGTLRYAGWNEIPDLASKAAKVEFTQNKSNGWLDAYGGRAGNFIWEVITVLFLGSLIMWIAPKYLPSVTKRAKDSMWRSMGYGAMILFLTPIIAILILITIVGIPVSVLLFMAYIGLLLFSSVVSAYYVGNAIRKNQTGTGRDQMFNLLVGAVALGVLNFFPIVGGILQFFIMLIALGAIWFEERQVLGNYR